MALGFDSLVGSPGTNPNSRDPMTVTPESITGDSLTRLMRSLSNITGNRGEQLFGQGQDVLSKGMGTLSGPTDYWASLLKGDPNATNQAIAPESRRIVTQYDAARKAISEFGGRGGGKNETLANLPFKQAGDINSLIQRLRPEAASQMTQIASLLLNLGVKQEDLGRLFTSGTFDALLGRRGQNVTEHGQAMSMASSMGNTLLGSDAGQLAAKKIGGLF